MKKKVVTVLTVLTILGETLVNVPNIAFAVDEIEAKDNEINELKAQESEVEGNIRTIEGQITDLEAEIDGLQTDLEDAQEYLDRLEEEIDELKDRINKRHKRIEKNARALQVNKSSVWLNYLKIIFDKNSNWGQKISALTSISKVMSSQRELIEQQEIDYTILQNKETVANEKIALIKANMEKIQQKKEELERLKAELEVQKLELAVRRASAEDEKGVLIAKREAAQAAQREAAERQKRAAEERVAAQQKERQRFQEYQQSANTTFTRQTMAQTSNFSSQITSYYGSGTGKQCTEISAGNPFFNGAGNANNYANHTLQNGGRVDENPNVGEIVQFKNGCHVAKAIEDLGDKVKIFEHNYAGHDNTRVVSKSEVFALHEK